jgi:hypothetical protein
MESSEFPGNIDLDRPLAELPREDRVQQAITQNMREIPPAPNRTHGYTEAKLRPLLSSFFSKPEVFAPIQMDRKGLNIDDPRFPEEIRGNEYFFFDRQIDIPEWRTIYSFSPRLDQVAFEVKGFKDVAPVDMAEALTFVVDEQIFLEDRLANAKKFLGKHFPALIPSEPTVMVAEYLQRYQAEYDMHTAIDNAAYYGVYEGTHYIGLDIRSDGLTNAQRKPVNPDSSPYKTMSSFDLANGDSATAHELIHQKVNEAFRRQSGVIEEVEDNSHIPPNDVIKLKSVSDVQIEHDTLAGLIDEGFATYFDIKLQRLTSFYYLRTGGEGAAYNTHKLRKMAENQALRLELDLTQTVPNENKTGDIHAYGFDVLERLAIAMKGTDTRVYVDKELSQLVDKIDWVACSKIKKGTPEYEAICQDPTRLPMIGERPLAIAA